MRAEPKLICLNWNILYPRTFEAQDTLPYVAQRSMNQMFGTIISQTTVGFATVTNSCTKWLIQSGYILVQQNSTC